MRELSGLVAILDEKGEVVETRQLGPVPIQVKENVRPMVEERPTLAGEEQQVFSEYVVAKDKVTAVYDPIPVAVETPSLEERVAVLEKRLDSLKL